MLPLDETQQAEVDKLNDLLPHAPVIDGLQEGQEKITTTLDKLIEDFENESESTKREFENGTKKFKEVFTVLGNVINKVDKVDLRVGNVEKEVSDMKNELIGSIENLGRQIEKKEMTDLTDEVKSLRTEKKEKAKNIDKLKWAVAGTLFTMLITYIPTIIDLLMKASTK